MTRFIFPLLIICKRIVGYVVSSETVNHISKGSKLVQKEFKMKDFFRLSVIVEVFRLVVSGLSVTTRQLHGTTCCLWILQCFRPSGTSVFGTLWSLPSLYSVLEQPHFGCVHATIFLAWTFSIDFCIVNNVTRWVTFVSVRVGVGRRIPLSVLA